MSRDYHSDVLGSFCEKIAKKFGYENVLLHNGGTESTEATVKLVRRWGVEVKGINNSDVVVLFPNHAYWGGGLGGLSLWEGVTGYGPLEGLKLEQVKYNDVEALEQKFKENPNIAGYLVEPVQAHGGIIIPN